jgi:hypothetical protein
MTMTDLAIRPFRVDIPEEDLDDLRRRIAATRLPERETTEGGDPCEPRWNVTEVHYESRLQSPVRPLCALNPLAHDPNAPRYCASPLRTASAEHS